MSYVIRDGKVETAKPIKNLNEEQKKVLKVTTAKQADKIKALKAKLAS
ncbi:hypothetical protein Sulku_0414 [Sulfuricurvum kujiense DSM 16994]|uniref:Uncharacterized protein n=1 Tax=Sulfuricurvum kujiense (strain ATCC BAA-921 / DSM 16994 / JCM 11577 / YK-1) TaxID=709032 RepID=E4TZJ3_SULKY|nr:hypothetical protein [Sulfuricurvum kujiense]ADR33081.1 hypothetical protein Sulku_0414 [Sulfuricurvum kujiense DSM 16994]